MRHIHETQSVGSKIASASDHYAFHILKNCIKKQNIKHKSSELVSAVILSGTKVIKFCHQLEHYSIMKHSNVHHTGRNIIFAANSQECRTWSTSFEQKWEHITSFEQKWENLQNKSENDHMVDFLAI